MVQPDAEPVPLIVLDNNAMFMFAVLVGIGLMNMAAGWPKRKSTLWRYTLVIFGLAANAAALWWLINSAPMSEVIDSTFKAFTIGSTRGLIYGSSVIAACVSLAPALIIFSHINHTRIGSKKAGAAQPAGGMQPAAAAPQSKPPKTPRRNPFKAITLPSLPRISLPKLKGKEKKKSDPVSTSGTLGSSGLGGLPSGAPQRPPLRSVPSTASTPSIVPGFDDPDDDESGPATDPGVSGLR